MQYLERELIQNQQLQLLIQLLLLFTRRSIFTVLLIFYSIIRSTNGFMHTTIQTQLFIIQLYLTLLLMVLVMLPFSTQLVVLYNFTLMALFTLKM
ncbi:MAG: hypothetical protein ACFFD2_02370 [Promethearchaeota archaeon]